jgi:cation:H+ antiporter
MEIVGLIFAALVALAIILAGCELFTNGIEWFGSKLNLSTGAVGSVLAAVGTALPETLVPIVALVFTGGSKAEEIGIGAILGAPFMLATLAFMMTGLAAIFYHRRGRRGLTLTVDTHTLGQDMAYFLGVYVVAIALSFLPGKPLKVLGAVLLLGAYVFYVHRHFCRECATESEDLNPLYLHRRAETPRLRFVLLQIVVSLAAIFFGAHLFVQELEKLSEFCGISALVLSLIITPVATELPEKFNSVLWIGRGKDTLALGNITGAMVFQSCIPVLVGVTLTPWNLMQRPEAVASAVIALLSVAIVFITMRVTKRLSPYVLLLGAPLYALWLWFAFRH